MSETLERFGLLRMGAHWAIAALLIFQIPLAWYMIELPNGPDKLGNYALHKSIGITLFAIAVFRLVWALLSKRPKLPGNMPVYEKALAKISQAILYIIIILMPLTGWIMSSAANFPVSVFGIFTLPNIVEPSKQLMEGMQQAHLMQSYVLLTILGGHVIGALKHGFVDQDNVLYSMLPLKSLKNEE